MYFYGLFILVFVTSLLCLFKYFISFNFPWPFSCLTDDVKCLEDIYIDSNYYSVLDKICIGDMMLSFDNGILYNSLRDSNFVF